MAKKNKPTAEDFRLLVVGGKNGNVPKDQVLCSVEHLDADTAKAMLQRGSISFTAGSQPHLILVFRDYISHGPSTAFKEAAKLWGIPFVVAKGGFGALVEEARSRGIDIRRYIVETPIKRKSKPMKKKKKRGPKPAPKAEAAPQPVHKPEPEPKEKEAVLDNKTAWIRKYPTKAFEIASDGVVIPVHRTKAGLCLLPKGAVLEFLLEEVRTYKMGKGPRGALERNEIRALQRKLEKRFGLKKLDVHVPSYNTIGKYVGYILDTLTEDQAMKMAIIVKSHTVDVPRQIEYVKPGAASAPEPKPAPEPEPKPSPEPKATPAPKRKTAPAPKAEEKTVDKISELYERLLDARTENAAFIEQISQLEETVKRKDKRIEELQKKLKVALG